MSQLRPYDSVNFEITNKDIKIQCPWLEMAVEVEEENISSVNDAVQKIQRQEFDTKTSEFLSFFQNYPILQQSASSQPIINQHANFSNLALEESPQEVCASYLNINLTSKTQWQWDIEKVLEASYIADEDLYDPVSVYYSTRNLRLLSEGGEDQNIINYLENLLKLDEEKFFKAIKKVLHQTYFVTKNCVPSLAPALDRNPNTADMIQDYIDSENGHHNLVHFSLKRLGSLEIDESLFLKESKASMTLLQKVAKDHYLAFCCVLEAFEGNSFRESDPIADIIRKSSKPDAAIGIDKHHEINREEDHANIGYELVKNIGAVSKEEVTTAVRYCELVTILGNELIKALQNDH